MSTRHTVVETTLGPITVVAHGEAVTGLYFDDHVRRPPESSFGPAVPAEEDPTLAIAAEQLTEYLAGRRRAFRLTLDPDGGTFERSVWAIIAEIPYGATTTYGDIAERLGNRTLAQRVGQAVGANPLSIVVPCHRVIGSTGSLTGYAGGLARKRRLLDLEQPAATAGAGRLF